MSEVEKSSGHLAFDGIFEYYLVNDCIYRAQISNVVMPDGYRDGRFECYKNHPFYKHLFEVV